MAAAHPTSAVLALALCLGLASTDAPAGKVGVAAAVNPDAYSSLGSGARKQLSIGKSIFFNERITTDDSGVVQVLLVDGSTFTVGRNSNLVIDRFVYDPKTSTGEIVTSFSKGTMRFVGGKISKSPGGVTVRTPDGSLAVRGGMFQGSLSGGGTIFSFLYGKELTYTAKNGKTYTVYQSGYTLDLSGGTPRIRPTTPADTARLMAALTNSNTNTAGLGIEYGPPRPRQALAETLSLQQLIIDATSTAITSDLAEQMQNIGKEPPDMTDPVIQSTNGGYASGIVVSFTEETLFLEISGAKSPDDLKLNENTNRAAIVLHEYSGTDIVDRYVFRIPTDGGISPTPFNATVYATENRAYPSVSATGYFVQGNPSSQQNNLCQDCDFIKWGAFGATVTFGDNENPEAITDAINPGWWVSSDITASADLPQRGSATYEGTAVGTVIEAAAPQSPRIARGDLGIRWNFAQRSGSFAISDFDRQGPAPLNISGPISMPGAANRFRGDLRGTAGSQAVTGGAIGSFAKQGTDPAAGVVGNWRAIGASGYRATGVFAGRR